MYLDVQLQAGGNLALPAMRGDDAAQTPFELAVYPVQGDIHIDEQTVAANVLAVLQPGVPVHITAQQPARLAIVGGAPLDGPRNICWNFVSRRKERIVQAAQGWEAQRLGQVPGESEFIPLQEQRFTP